MKSIQLSGESPHTLSRSESVAQPRNATSAPVASTINTILAVREHAPAEIDELEGEIETLHRRLGTAYARKRLLEQLLSVIRQADGDPTMQQFGISVLR